MPSYTEQIRRWLYDNRKEYKNCIIALSVFIAVLLIGLAMIVVGVTYFKYQKRYF